MLPSRAQLSTQVRSPHFLFLATATALVILDGLIAMPWTGTVGMPPRMFLVHLLLLAVFWMSSAGQRQLLSFAAVGVVGLALRDMYLPTRIELVPRDFGAAVGLASTAMWFTSLWFVVSWSSVRRQLDRIHTRQHDTLTGLCNRDFFEATLRGLLSHSRRRTEDHVGLLLVSLSVAADTDAGDPISYDSLLSDVATYLMVGARDSQLHAYRPHERAYPCYLGCGGRACGRFAVIISDLPDEAALRDQRRNLQQSLDEFLLTRTGANALSERVIVVSSYAHPGTSDWELIEAAYRELAAVVNKQTDPGSHSVASAATS